jgi:exonuclease SbcC
MLAQSEFGAFLKADDKERSELLEKLTNTAIYTRLGQRAFSKARKPANAQRPERSASTCCRWPPRPVPSSTSAWSRRSSSSRPTRPASANWSSNATGSTNNASCRPSTAKPSSRRPPSNWQQLAEQRLDLQRLERLAPQRHQFHRQQDLAGQLAPLAAAIAEQQRQQGELQVRTSELEQALETARQAWPSARPSTAITPRACARPSPPRTPGPPGQELGEQRAACQQAEQEVADGQQHLQQLEENQQRSLQQLAQIDAALADSQHLAAWPMPGRPTCRN